MDANEREFKNGLISRLFVCIRGWRNPRQMRRFISAKPSECIVLNALRRCGGDPLSLASFALVLGWLHEDDSLFR